MKASPKNASTLLLGLALLLPASAAVASPDAQACLPKVAKGWIRAAPPTATMLAGYAEVRNDCKQAFVLTGAKSPDFMMAQVHSSTMANGMSQMEQVKRTTLAAGAVFRLEPGQHHLMLMHPRRKLPEGSVVKVELLLSDGRKIPAELTVRKDAPKK